VPLRRRRTEEIVVETVTLEQVAASREQKQRLVEPQRWG